MVIKIHGADKLLKKYNNLKGINLKRGYLEAALHVQGDVQEKVPVDTGRLKGSIRADSTEDYGRVFTDVEYAIYVEYGTSKMKAQPFLRPSLVWNEKHINRILEDYIKLEIDKNAD
jgi:HK97 gp10 family phage protein